MCTVQSSALCSHMEVHMSLDFIFFNLYCSCMGYWEVQLLRLVKVTSELLSYSENCINLCTQAASWNLERNVKKINSIHNHWVTQSDFLMFSQFAASIFQLYKITFTAAAAFLGVTWDVWNPAGSKDIVRNKNKSDSFHITNIYLFSYILHD